VGSDGTPAIDSTWRSRHAARGKEEGFMTLRCLAALVALISALGACASSSCPCAPVTVTSITPPPPVPSGSQPGIIFRDELGAAFQLTRAVFFLDRAPLLQLDATDDKPLPREILVPGAVPSAGEHELYILLELRGHGSGADEYLRGYRFEVKSAHRFTVVEGRPLRLEGIAWARPAQAIEQRPAIRYVESVKGVLVPPEMPCARL
jgi:hypothetical protein